MTVAAVEKNDEAEVATGVVEKKKVHFDEKQIFSRKGHKKLQHKKVKLKDRNDAAQGLKSKTHAESQVKNTKRDESKANSINKAKVTEPPKVVFFQAKAEKQAIGVIPDTMPPKASSAKKSPSPKPKSSLSFDGNRTSKPKADLKKTWPFVDIKEQLKLDMYDITRQAIKKSAEGFKMAIDSSNTLKPINKTDIPTLGFRRRSSLGLHSNYDALNVLTSIQEQQKRRHQEHIRSQLAVIQNRVRQTLEDIGMESDSEEEETPVKPAYMHVFDTAAERKKMQERNYIMGCVETFEEKALVRKQYLTELMFWFEDNLNLSSDVITPDEMREMIKTTQELHEIISQSLESFIETGGQVVEKGRLLLAETSKIIEERKAQMAKKTKKERITVYDEKTLLSDPLKWEAAAKTILSVFEDSHKMIKNLMFKNALRLCQKQFEYMMLVCEKCFKEIEEKKKQCLDLQGKLHAAKIQSDKQNRENEEQKRKYRDMCKELADTKKTLDDLQEKNTIMKQTVVELNSNIKFLQEELQVKLRTPTPPPTPPPPEPEKIYVKVVDSSTELKLTEVEAELDNAKKEIEALLSQLNELNEQFKIEQDKSKSLQERVTALENIEIPEPVVTPKPPVEVEAAPTTEDHKPLDLPDKDANYYKTLMVGMKKEFGIEMEKVKSHVRREKTRGEAHIKKLEYQHKDHLANIQKDTVRMLRAIMHFREHMMTCLEKENLIDQAQALQDLGDLIKDKQECHGFVSCHQIPKKYWLQLLVQLWTT